MTVAILAPPTARSAASGSAYRTVVLPAVLPLLFDVECCLSRTGRALLVDYAWP